MPEIGATLREARMRARIDISEIESQTKIRAKYLRALENEEWDLLPGPTYVKSFLRTYADALGLDGKRLVEEYKLQFERLTDVDLQPLAPPGRRGDRQTRPRFRRAWVVALVLVVLVGALYALGRGSGDEGGDATPAATATTDRPPTPTTQAKADATPSQAATPRRIRLQVIPTAPVYVCLVADGKPVVDGEILQPGSRTRTFRARRFDIGLGNGSVTLRVSGRAFDVPESSSPIGYRFTAKGRTSLPESRRPTCAAQ